MPSNYQLSWTPETTELKHPKYLSLYQYIARDIYTGRLVSHQPMPSQRELSYYLNIHFTTVTRAYKLAINQGLLYAITGKGTFVAPQATINQTVFKDQIPVRNINLGFVDAFGVQSQSAQAIVKQAVQQSQINQLMNYHPIQLDDDSKVAAQHLLSFLNIPFANHSILQTNGAQAGLATVLGGLFHEGDKIAVDTYTYSNFIELAKLFKLKLVPITQDADGMLVTELKQKIINGTEKIAGVYVMPLRSNPTNITLSWSRRQELVELAQQYHLLILEDDYLRFTAPQQLPTILELAPEQTIEIVSTSKIIAPGLRIGFLVFAQRYWQVLSQTFINLNAQSSALDAEVFHQLMKQRQLSRLTSQRLNQLKQAQQIFTDVFQRSVPLSFHQCLPLPVKTDWQKLQTKLQTAHLTVLAGSHYQVDPLATGNFLRVSLASTNSMAELRYGLVELKKVLASM